MRSDGCATEGEGRGVKQERTRMMLAMVEPSEAQRLVLRIYFNHSE